MSGKSFISLLAGAALLAAAPALAHGADKGASKSQSAVKSKGAVKSNGRTSLAATVAAERRSQASSVQSLGQRSNNGADTIVTDGPLAGLATGMTVLDPAGAAVGTVERIRLARDGSVRMVQVRSVNGRRIIPLSPARLTLNGGTLMTDSLKPGLGRGL